MTPPALPHLCCCHAEARVTHSCHVVPAPAQPHLTSLPTLPASVTKVALPGLFWKLLDKTRLTSWADVILQEKNGM
jgi:hypothetical protein